MLLPFGFEGKGVLDLEFLVKNKNFIIDTDLSGVSSCLFHKDCFLTENIYNISEPTSVLDSERFPSRATSSSTHSSSLGGGGGGGGSTNSVAAVSDTNPFPKWHVQQDSTTATRSNGGGGADSELLPVPPSLEIGTGGGNCGLEDWESVMSESPGQEQSILRWIMGDTEETMGSLDKVLQIGGGGGGLGLVEQGFGGGEQFNPNFMPSLPSFSNRSERKPSILNPQLLLNQHQAHQAQNPSFFIPEQNLFIPPLAKRHNPSGGPNGIRIEPGGPVRQQEHYMGRQQLNPHQLQLLPHYLNQKPKMDGGDEFPHFHQQQQGIIDQLHEAAELVQTGNPILAQGILARLNHTLSPIGKPFCRAAFYFKEALQSLLQPNNLNPPSPFSLIFKIAAYKSFSEISPLIQFANFTCNQALLDVFEGFDKINIVDFDIGYGGQWASLMQELALRPGGPPLLKITALASPETHDKLELGLTRENLIQFSSEINIGFEFDILSIDSLNSCSWSLPFHPSENEAVAVNLPVGVFANYQLPLPLVLRFVKQLSPRLVVSVDRGCDRTDLPFSNHIIHALQSYSNWLESLDAVNMNMDALQKIERFLLQPGIEKIVTGRFRFPEKTQHWKTQFLSSGFSPVSFSNFTESQAECVIKRTPVRGFQVEKRQSSLVLSWQRKELISVSAWRC